MPAPIFDSHVHLFSADRVTYPMVPGRERPLDHDGSVETQIHEMDAAGVATALMVQTPWLGEDNRYLVESMRRYPGRFVGLGWLEDPVGEDAPERLIHQYEEDGFRGVRLHLTEARVNEGVLAGKADPLFREAHRLGVPVQFLNRVPTHPTILGVAERFPDLTLIVDHLGHPDPAEAPEYPSSEPFFALAQFPKVYVKVSNHVISSNTPYPWADLHAYQRRMVHAFGPRRLMWGSNWPMQLPPEGPTYLDRIEAVRTHLPGVSAEDLDWIMGRTAFSLWPVA